ncbi:MAG TPA: tetratricopeptide repeat protein [Phycisphaerae bacterium]
MARRVNTKFVVIMAASLAGAVAVGGGVMLYSRWHGKDPAVVKVNAEAQEKDGLEKMAAGKTPEGIKSLKMAVDNFAWAGSLTAKNHLTGADLLFAHAAELCEKISKTALSQEDAIRYYQLTGIYYDQALNENPYNKQVNETLLDQRYQDVQYFPSTEGWQRLEVVAGKLIDNQDGLKPRLARAEARIRRLQTGGAEATTADIKAIHDDLDKAQAFDPKSGKEVALRGEEIWVEAMQAVRRRSFVKIDDLLNDEIYTKAVADVNALFQGYLDNSGMDADVSHTFARILLNQYQLQKQMQVTAVKRAATQAGSVTQTAPAASDFDALLDRAITILEGAYKAHPDVTSLADLLGQLYLGSSHPEKAEALVRAMIAKAPDDIEGRYRLAIFFRNINDFPKAIDAYKDVLKHPAIGSGRDAIRNSSLTQQSTIDIAWLNLNMADFDSATPEQKAAYLKEAAEYTDKLRTSHAPPGIVNLLDGRGQLANHDTLQAIKTLRDAETTLNGDHNLVEWYRQTELQLAEANDTLNQPGAALDYVNKALAVSPNEPGVIIQKAQLYTELRRYGEAVLLVMSVLGERRNGRNGQYANEQLLPAPLVYRAKRVMAQAESGQGKPQEALQALTDAGAILMRSLAELNLGGDENINAAIADAQSIYEDQNSSEADAIVAYQVAVGGLAQSKRTDQAKALLAQAMAKYPKNSALERIKLRLDLPPDADAAAVTNAIINGISDDYLKLSAIARLYDDQQKYDEEIKSLQDAEAKVGASAKAEDKNKLNSLQDRIFNAALNAAAKATDPAKRNGYFETAEAYVIKAERLNIDGTEGKLYRGRLELARSDGAKGIDILANAVSQHPDYALGHLILGQSYYYLGIKNAKAKNTAAATGNFNSALDEFRQVIRLTQNNVPAIEFAVRLLLQKGDSTSLKEAQSILAMGLAIAPFDPTFISASELLTGDVDDAIAKRIALLKADPENRENATRLAILYVRKKESLTDPAQKQAAINAAISIMDADHKSHPDDLQSTRLLIQLYVENDKSGAGVKKALDVLQPYLANDNQDVRFNALIVKAEFLRTANVSEDGKLALAADGTIKKPTLNEEAAGILAEAAKIEPEGSDMAERHLADMYFDLGMIHLNEPENPYMDAAEKAYLAVVEKNKSPEGLDSVNRRLIEVRLRLATVLMSRPELDEEKAKANQALAGQKMALANSSIDEMLKRDPRDTQVLMLRASINIQVKAAAVIGTQKEPFIKAGIDDLNAVLKTDPGNSTALYFRAVALIQLGERLDLALQDLNDAAKHDKDNIRTHLTLAEVYTRMQRYEDASLEYKTLVTANPDNFPIRKEYTDFLYNLSVLQSTLPPQSDEVFAQSIRNLKPQDVLLEQIKDALVHFPNMARWYYMYAQLLSLVGNEPEALKWYKSLRDAAPTDMGANDAYVESLRKNKNYAEAIAEATRLIDPNKEILAKNPRYVTFYLNRAASYQQTGKSQEAIADIDQALDVAVAGVVQQHDYPPFIAVLTEAGNILSPDLVAQRLVARLANHPDETITRIGLMQTYGILNKPFDALKIIDKPLNSGNDKVLLGYVIRETAVVHFLCGEAYNKEAKVTEAKQQFQLAETSFKQLLADISPNDVTSLNNYAFMLADGMNRPKDAIPFAEKALKILRTGADPYEVNAASGDVLDTLGWAKVLAGDLPAGIANLESSVQMNPTVAAYLHLAKGKIKNGQKDEAVLKLCQEGIKLATMRHDPLLADLKTLQDEITPSVSPKSSPTGASLVP